MSERNEESRISEFRAILWLRRGLKNNSIKPDTFEVIQFLSQCGVGADVKLEYTDVKRWTVYTRDMTFSWEVDTDA